ncbi:MAG: alanine dehydrogenase [Planctomycetes bacterium]|nr:alanine dehydrogenase [Planctomycetota bacterium]
MKVGVTKEIKNNEYRVGMIPSGVSQIVSDSNEVFVETNAGAGIGFSDQDYINSGAKILPSLEAVFEASEMIVKVKEPQPREIAALKPHHLLYTYLHLAADEKLTKDLMNTGATSIAYETIELADGSLPLLTPMSEVAGRMSTIVGAYHLMKHMGGLGMMLGGVPGVPRAKVTVMGCGVAGRNAIKMAVGLGGDVTAIDISHSRLTEIDDLFDNKITTLHSNPMNIEEAVINSDLVIGAVLVAGAKAPHLVTKDMIKKMKKGAVIVDIAVDQGGCIETTHPTTHENPTFEVDGVLHYCVANMPGAFAKTSTFALTNSTMRYARILANKGLQAVIEDEALLKGVNTHKGGLVYEQVAKDLSIPYTPFAL